MPSACGSRSCLCQSVSRAGNHCRARRGGYHPPEAFPPAGGRWMAEGQTDEGFPRSHAWVPLAGRACPAGAPISSRRNGGKKGQGLRPLNPQNGGSWRRWAVQTGQRPGRHCRPPHWLALAVTGAPAEAQRSGFGGERRPSGGNELSGLPGSERSVAWADDAAPWAARIGITRQALKATALYRLGPPGRRWCHAAERSWRLWRHTAHSESAPPVGRGLAPAGADEGLRVQRTGIYIQ